MKRSFGLASLLYLPIALLVALAYPCAAQNAQQQLAFAGLRAVAGKGQFNAVRTDSAGNLYLLLDQKDGVRVLKTDPGATQIYAQAHLGAPGDIGIDMALDPAGNVYVTGISTSGVLSGTAGAAFPSRADSSTNSFIAKLDPSLNTVFVTFAGSSRTAVTGIAATADAVFITGSIFAATLPVTSSAIIQSPSSGSTGNGFVERFDTAGSTLIYATYLSGYGGDTAPAAIAADANDNAYIGGYTTASGYPTTSAVVPVMIGNSSGFLTKLAPSGDGIVFSTFIPGNGITSLVYDNIAQNILFSGPISSGGFPVATVLSPLVDTTYQVAVRMSSDGSQALNSTLLAPGSTSVVHAATNGTAWAALPLSAPLLPLQAISNIGTSAALHITTQGSIDQSIRVGGAGPSFNAPVSATISGIATDSYGQPIFAGAANPTTSQSLLGTRTFDLPLYNNPTAALPSTLRDAVLPAGTNCGSLCTGSGAYLSKLLLTAGPSLALSTDSAPNLTLRNLGSQVATNLSLSASSFTLTHNCPSPLGAGAECSIALNGSGPGSVTVQTSNATPQTVSIGALTASALPIVFSPSEVDLGIITPGDPKVTRTITASNLTTSTQIVPYLPYAPGTSSPISISSDCPGGTSPTLTPGASCHLTFGLTATPSTTPGFASAVFSSTRTTQITATGFVSPTALGLSTSTIDFGTQYSTGSLRLPRYLYISNNSSTSITHTRVTLPAASIFTVTDHCPTLLEPHTVCQLRLDYESPSTSADSITLVFDQGLSVLVTGRTVPEPGAGGATVNLGLTVTPSALTFSNSVAVTTTSSSSQTVTIANTGAQPFPLALALSGDFLYSTSCPGILAAGTNCSAVITFAPSQSGTRQGLLTISSGAGTAPAYVNLTGTGTDILASNNGTLDLGSTIIGQPVVQWIRITQPFTQMTATTSSDFSVILVEDIGYGHGAPPSSAFTPAATGSCFNCWLGVQFRPSTAGLSSASLALSTSSSGNPYVLTVIGTGLPLSGLVLTPTQQDFGPIAVNSSSAPVIFTLTNLTPTTATLSTPILTGDFAISNTVTGGTPCASGALAASASCLLAVAYTPSATGAHTGTLTISSGTETATATLSGYGAADTGLAVNPAALIFHNVPGATATQQTITLTNTGIYNLQVGTPSTDASGFTATSTCGTLTPGASCTITVSFTPSTATIAGTLSIPVTSSAFGNPATTYTVPLSGAYTAEDAYLQIVPGQASYGPTATGTLGLTRQFTINNLTAQSLNLSLSLPRQYVLTTPSCTTLGTNGSCTFSVAFLPLTNGDITGTIAVEATPSGQNTTYSSLGYVEGYGNGSGQLTVTGNFLPGNILDFGQLASGQTKARTITLTNTGNQPMTVRRITSEWPFLATTTCGATLSPAASCTATLIYSPLNQVASGSSPAPFATDAGTLVIESDAGSSPEFIDLTGTVTPAVASAPSNTAPLVSYTLSQGSLVFATTSGGNASAPQTVTLTNTGTATIHITGVNTGTADFTATNTCSTLVPAASCLITATFSPQATSSQSVTPVIGALEITSDASTTLNFVSLYATAAPSTLTLSPASLDFGAVLVGASATLPIQVTNGSPNAATFSGITATGDYTVTSNCPAAGGQLAPGSGCTLQISFTPTQAGTRSGTVSLTTSLTSLPLIVNLTGSGAQSHLQATPASLSFADTTIGNSTRLILSLANTGTAPVTRIALSITGDYTITTPCSSTTLASGASCAVSIAFNPTAAGSRTGTLTVTSSDSSSPLLIPLNGNGVDPAAFNLTVNGGSTSTVAVTSGQPANYALTLTPLRGYTGAVIFNCTPVNPGQYASCSLLPSSITVSNSTTQTATATINTVTSVATSLNRIERRNSSIALCLLPFGALLLRRRRAILAIVLMVSTSLLVAGCGSGGTLNLADPNLRYTPPGSYQYQVTATSATGAPLSQTVTLNLTVTAR
jgi:hypothetical protein